MNRAHHHVVGGVAGLWLAAATHQPLWQAGVAAALATMTAGGRMSPDADQYRGWRVLDRFVPDEWLGKGGPLQHRGISHWWGIPAAGAVTLWQVAGPWWAWALLAGWASHLVGDFVFGHADPYAHRGPGIPVAPWWWHHGVGLKSGGALEWVTSGLVVAPAGLWAVAVLTGTSGPILTAGGPDLPRQVDHRHRPACGRGSATEVAPGVPAYVPGCGGVRA